MAVWAEPLNRKETIEISFSEFWTGMSLFLSLIRVEILSIIKTVLLMAELQ